jgi:hypothetical protein
MKHTEHALSAREQQGSIAQGLEESHKLTLSITVKKRDALCGPSPFSPNHDTLDFSFEDTRRRPLRRRLNMPWRISPRSVRTIIN